MGSAKKVGSPFQTNGVEVLKASFFYDFRPMVRKSWMSEMTGLDQGGPHVQSLWSPPAWLHASCMGMSY